uniref:tRNA pseudouridine synthase A n=1 Tax=Talaromyces marneffei PM1 TaxID=1077442 RepID=A0A093V3X8_TALMA
MNTDLTRKHYSFNFLLCKDGHTHYQKFNSLSPLKWIVLLKLSTDRFMAVTKVPDGAFYPSLGRKWPTIALEVGYAESYEDLVRDATLLMEGSKGKIGLVIIVKLQPLEADETEIQKGFVEVWAYNYERKNCFKLGQQERNLNPTKSPPPLLLDGLRMYIDGAVERFLSRKGLREDSSGVNFDWYS